MNRKGDAPRTIHSVATVLAPIILLLAVILAAPRFFSPAADVTNILHSWFEDIRPAGKLVVLSTRQRYTLSREFSARLLALIDLKASVGISVVADTSIYIDISDPDACQALWNRRTRVLSLRLPSARILPPAIMTESLEFTSRGANLLTESIFRLREAARSMEYGLSADLAREAESALSSPRMREEISSAVESLAERYLFSKYRIKPVRISIEFFPR